MTEAEFRALAAQGYNRIPLVLESFADLDTPLSLYVKLANERYTFLLESVVGGERFGRYSFIGLPAKIRIRARGTTIEVEDERDDRRAARGRSARVRPRVSCAATAPHRGRDCRASAAGSPASSATTRSATSRRKLADSAPPAAPGLAEVPDILLLLTEELAVVDNLAGKISLIVYADPGAAGRVREGKRATARRCGASCANRCRSRSRRQRP